MVDLARPALGGRVGGEITELQIETRTDPCHAVTDIDAQLVEARAALQAAAGRRGCG